MNETKNTVQLDDKSVLTANDLHRVLISDQKLALGECEGGKRNSLD